MQKIGESNNRLDLLSRLQGLDLLSRLQGKMSKVISFSISDRYLDKLRSLYPALTDNLAVKQFVTDGLDSNLGNSLDDGLDDGLDASVGLPPVTDEIEDSGTKNTLSRYFDRFPNRNR